MKADLPPHIKTRAEELAEIMIDQHLSECPETGVTIDLILGSLDNYDEFDELVVGCAAGSAAAARLLKHFLIMAAVPLIGAELMTLEKEKKDDRTIEQHERNERFKRAGNE